MGEFGEALSHSIGRGRKMGEGGGRSLPGRYGGSEAGPTWKFM